MSDSRFHRFSRFQVIFHWVVGLPYLLLLGSGALIMLHRLDVVTLVPPRVLSVIHRWTGIAFAVFLAQLIFSALITGNARSMARDILDWFRFGWRDLLWLVMVPLNIVAPHRFHLPAAGRFNAGQKLHGAFIVLAVILFTVTGLLIMYRPAALRPWLIHSWLFFGAAAFLCLHLFLSLINPVTRRALGGIFSGYVPRQYIEDHHPLELPAPPPRHRPHAVVSPIALIVTAVIAVALGGVALFRYGPSRAAAKVTQISHQEHPMISPGPLIAAHAIDPRAVHCEACHQGLEPPQNSACLACHQKIQDLMQANAGFHGQLTADCRSCHTDHKGPDADIRALDEQDFNHQLARFHLVGQHSSLKCDQCHLDHSGVSGQRRFIGLKFQACLDCHDNPHPPTTSADCQRCHSERGWTGRELHFVHDRDSDFQLKGRHATLACAECHKPLTPQATLATATFTGLSHNCAECHQDPHRGQFNQACTVCHDEQGWKGRQLLFDHARHSDFRLDATHAAIDCASCHVTIDKVTRYASTPSTCEACHADISNAMAGRNLSPGALPDPHFNRVTCADCHPSDVRAPTAAQYADSCQECHGQRYRTVYFQWQKSLDERSEAVRNLITRSSPDRAATLATELDRSRRIGMHNLTEAVKLLEAAASRK